MANIIIKMAQYIKALGKMTYNKGRDSKCGRMARVTKERTWRAVSKASASIPGPMALCTRAIGMTTRSTASDSTGGRMVAGTTGSGCKMKCPGTVLTSTPMASSMKANSWTTKRQAMVNTFGPMGATTRAGGTAASSTVLAFLWIHRKESRSMVYGSSASGFNGSTSK